MQKISSTLLRIIDLANNVKQFDFDGQVDFQAGQFVLLEVEDGKEPSVSRAYSIASAPGLDGFSLCVKLEPGGRGGEYLWSLQVGDAVNFQGPSGHFTWKESAGDLIFVATGVGLAPFMSMFQVMGDRKATLYFGVRHEEELFYLDELAKFENLKVISTLSQPGADWVGVKGRVTDHLQDLDVSPDTNVYICGNGNMVKEVKEMMESKGLPKSQIHFELFTPISK